MVGGAGLFAFHDGAAYDTWTGATWERRRMPLSEADYYDLVAAVGDDAPYLAGTDARPDAVILRGSGTWPAIARESFDPDRHPTAIARLPGRSVIGTLDGDLFDVGDDGTVRLLAALRRSISAVTIAGDRIWAVGAGGLVASVPIPE